MSHAAARKAIESKLKTWATAKPITLIFGTGAIDQPSAVYLRGFPLPAGTTTRYIGGDANEYTGVYQVSIICLGITPVGIAEGIIAELNTLFPVDSALSSGTFRGYVVQPVSQGPTIDEDDRYNVPVTIFYYGMDGN